MIHKEYPIISNSNFKFI